MNRPIPFLRAELTVSTQSPPVLGDAQLDSAEEDRELWILEQEICTELERIENKQQDLNPIGQFGIDGKHVNYVEEEEEEDEEEDDNDDDESDSHEDDDEEEIDMEIDELQDSPTF